MVTTVLTDAELRHFERKLRKQRTELFRELGRLSESLAEVLEARSDSSADDEHDPEGPNLTMEWARLSGVHHDFAEKLAAIDRAMHRIDDGSYGICVRRGEPISRERLEARPAAELCIDCARELEAARHP